VKFGDVFWDDEFGSIDIPRFFIDQSFFTERDLTILKYYDMSEELNMFDEVAVEMGTVNTTSMTNATFDNRFDFITLEKDSLLEVQAYMNK